MIPEQVRLLGDLRPADDAVLRRENVTDALHDASDRHHRATVDAQFVDERLHAIECFGNTAFIPREDDAPRDDGGRQQQAFP